METNQADGLLIGPDDGKVITNPVGGHMVIKLRDDDTNGAYSIHDNIIPAHSPGPRPHIHRYHDEVFYVLDGELTVRIGSQVMQASAGSFVVVPRGQPHQPSNPSPQPVRVLLLFSPSGMGSFFDEAARRRMPLQQAPADPDLAADLRAFTERYGYEFADED